MTSNNNNNDKYKEYRRNYYREYYRKYPDKYIANNKKRPKQKNIFYGVTINGVTYCFPNKSSIKINKVHKSDIHNDGYLIVSS